MKNKNTDKEYALNAQKGMKYFKYNGFNNDINSNNNSQITLTEYNTSSSDNWYRDYL